MAFQSSAFQNSAFQTIALSPVGPFGPIGQDVMNSGGNWRHHVPSWVWREQEKDRRRTQQRRNAAILALSL